MPPVLSVHRIIAVGVAVFFVLLLLFSAFHQGVTPIQTLKDTANSAAERICTSGSDHDAPLLGDVPFSQGIHSLYKSIRHSVTAKTYQDPTGRQFTLPDKEPAWTSPLGSKILIVDMDTRIPTGDNELWNPTTMDYASLDASKGGQMVSAAFMNHFLYSQIHGYDYKFFAAKSLKDHHDTWIKPHVLYDLLHSYQFVVFIDADATIQHLELPLEWLFNKWGIGHATTIAMPIDTEEVVNGDQHISTDSKGKVVLNTGFIVTQALPLAFEMLDAWRKCTTGARWKDCKQWATQWSHEQRAFSEYVRYDFNPHGNIVEIPCDDAMGFPGIVENNPRVISNCTGQFVRHQTIGKEATKTNAGNALMQSMAELMQKALIQEKARYWIADDKINIGSFLKIFQKRD
ncbi:uncharacterized protein EI97DRAFT_219911 [Westerdykella ornata]|uniref:Nucleotide-diphospho-sugar transferase domain-containing protein n=1 Tax=Westerdykella ornata TaxID=318751 RepID=A0A6A6JQ90_WESOR|nr:uncharacterized protein EI97DRAFT_219911 [Westerdykella ornata]KAF2278810.1 hypothetical protein EI97DRAFT_219911 [Westerdykella ornata]